MKTELHLCIIWYNAINKADDVLSEIRKRFKILDVYRIQWSKEHIIDNYKRFYSHSQHQLNPIQLTRLMDGKRTHCGDGPFKLIIFEDVKPDYQIRKTSNGRRSVNVNVFDMKQTLRDLTGGGHRIHGTDSTSETNKDLTLLLGKNYSDYKEAHPKEWDGKIRYLEQDVLGLHGFKNIKELFYLLNASINYVVLRNFEGFPDQITLDEHSDVDLLVENRNLLIYSTGAKPIFDEKYRVHYSINIDKKEVPFDVRYIGDNYYDKKWEKEILNARVFTERLFYIPDKPNYFYSLLYHALVHKPVFSDDYKNRLAKMGIESGETSLSEELLHVFMEQNHYKFTEPRDLSVFFNRSSLPKFKPVSLRRTLKYNILPYIKKKVKSSI